MPTFRTGRVTEVLAERPGLQRLGVRLEGEAEDSRAVNYPDIVGAAAVGDEIVCNTTAVELGLGTGGWHVVHWNLARREFSRASGGHIIKARYTSTQIDVASAEEQGSGEHDRLRDVSSIEGLPVMIAGLHSLVAAAAAGFKTAAPSRRLAYMMTDAAALPLVLSDLVADLIAAGLIDTTITVGHAFGGDIEAVTTASGLLAATHVAEADAVIAAMGPGVVGTGTRFGFTALEVGHIAHEVHMLEGRPIVVARVSAADKRSRHRGVSHHTLRALELAPSGTEVAIASTPTHSDLTADLETTGACVHVVEPMNALDLLAERGLSPTSMGRTIEDDPVLWGTAAAAGVFAAAACTTP